MFYDLNVPYTEEAELQRTIAFLGELGYNVLALSHILSGKLPADLTSPIPATPAFPVPSTVQLLRRCTLVVSDPSQNHRIASLSSAYDILAIRPVNEKSLQQACQSLDCDLISLDLTVRLGFYFKFKMLSQAIERGIKFEICYASGVMAADTAARRNLISNTTQLIRATRGRGLVISSEAKRAVGCRAPSDVINLAAVWGLGPERGHDAITKGARSVVVNAKFKRTSFRGAVDVVYGGEKPELPSKGERDKKEVQRKRKLDGASDGPAVDLTAPKPVSKREQKRQAKRARLEAAQNGISIEASTEAEIANGTTLQEPTAHPS